MLKAVDESGDLGMKFERGSTPLFTLGAVVFTNPQIASECNRRISSLRNELGFPDGHEFKFSHSSNEARECFLRAMAGYEFGYYISTLDKPQLAGIADYRDKDMLWQSAAIRLVDMTRPCLLNAELLIDSMNDRRMDRMMTKFLKNGAGERDGQPVVKNAKALKSHKHNLIQLADMITGAVVRSYCLNGERGCNGFRALIQRREQTVEVWP